jgi:glycosyltransferase involved in cell wall biosynthesis
VDDPFVPYWADCVADLASEHRVSVFPLRYPTAGPAFDLFGAEVVPLGHGDVRLRRSPALWLDALRAIAGRHRHVPFDLVLALHGNEAGFLAALAGARHRLPVVVRVGGGELTQLPTLAYGSQAVPIERLQVGIALARADVVTVGARGMQERVAQALGARAQRAAWAPYGVDTARFEPSPWPQRPRVLHVADLNPVKGQPTMLEAFSIVAAAEPEARLDLVGGGPQLLGLRRLARALGVADRLRWWGQIPHSAIHLVYRGASAFVLSSWHEGQGIVLAEAAAAGLPIAATRVGMAPDLPPAGTCLTQPGDAGALAASLLWSLAPDPARDPARAALRAAAVAEYDRAVCHRRLERILRQAVAARQS